MTTNKTLERVTRVVAPIIVGVVLLIAWQLYATKSSLGSDVLPTPTRVWLQGWKDHANLWTNTLPTLRATAIGFALSLVIGFLLSIAIDQSRLIKHSLVPILIISQTLPLIAIAPLMVLWFGFGLLPKVLIVALVTFFPITVSLVEGYESTDPDATRLLRSMGASTFKVFRLLRFPSAMPYFFSGLRIAITYAVVAAIFAEYAGAFAGLGIYMENAKNSFRTDLVLAAVAVSAVLTLALFGLTYALERVAVPWVRLRQRQERAAS